jgi:hypothetical protein
MTLIVRAADLWMRPSDLPWVGSPTLIGARLHRKRDESGELSPDEWVLEATWSIDVGECQVVRDLEVRSRALGDVLAEFRRAETCRAVGGASCS